MATLEAANVADGVGQSNNASFARCVHLLKPEKFHEEDSTGKSAPPRRASFVFLEGNSQGPNKARSEARFSLA